MLGILEPEMLRRPSALQDSEQRTNKLEESLAAHFSTVRRRCISDGLGHVVENVMTRLKNSRVWESAKLEEDRYNGAKLNLATLNSASAQEIRDDCLTSLNEWLRGTFDAHPTHMAMLRDIVSYLRRKEPEPVNLSLEELHPSLNQRTYYRSISGDSDTERFKKEKKKRSSRSGWRWEARLSDAAFKRLIIKY